MGLIQEGDKRQSQEIPGQRLIDYREFPEGLFMPVVNRVEEKYQKEYGRPLTDEQRVVCQQSFALSAVATGDPFGYRLYYKPGTETAYTTILGREVSKVSVRHMLTSWYKSGSSYEEIKRNKGLLKLVRNAVPEIKEFFEPIKEEVTKKLEEQRQLRYREALRVVPGDREYRDPKRGTSGVGGGHNYANLDEDMNPKGYPQGIEEDK